MRELGLKGAVRGEARRTAVSDDRIKACNTSRSSARIGWLRWGRPASVGSRGDSYDNAMVKR